MLTVTIATCKAPVAADYREWTHRARTDDPEVALRRAIDRHFGRQYRFFESRELRGSAGTRIGQLGYWLPSSNAYSLMPRVWVRID